jgi:hypothetical protein
MQLESDLGTDPDTICDSSPDVAFWLEMVGMIGDQWSVRKRINLVATTFRQAVGSAQHIPGIKKAIVCWSGVSPPFSLYAFMSWSLDIKTNLYFLLYTCCLNEKVVI